MIDWLTKLWCHHEWGKPERWRTYPHGTRDMKSTLPVRVYDIYICKKCLKRKEIVI